MSKKENKENIYFDEIKELIQNAKGVVNIDYKIATEVEKQRMIESEEKLKRLTKYLATRKILSTPNQITSKIILTR